MTTEESDFRTRCSNLDGAAIEKALQWGRIVESDVAYQHCHKNNNIKPTDKQMDDFEKIVKDIMKKQTLTDQLFIVLLLGAISCCLYSTSSAVRLVFSSKKHWLHKAVVLLSTFASSITIAFTIAWFFHAEYDTFQWFAALVWIAVAEISLPLLFALRVFDL